MDTVTAAISGDTARHRNSSWWYTRISARSRGSYRTVTGSPTYAARVIEKYRSPWQWIPSRCTLRGVAHGEQQQVQLLQRLGHPG